MAILSTGTLSLVDYSKKELGLTKKHKTFNKFKLSGQDYQENIKAKLPLKLTLFEHPRMILKR
jgi:hypothetical protein